MRISIERAISEAIPVDLHMHVCELTSYDPSPEVVLLNASPDWLLARLLNGSLNPDGYLAVKRAHVRFLRTTKFSAFRKRLLQTEGLWPDVIRPPAIDLKSTATILRSFQQSKRLAIILCEKFEEWDSIHCRVERVSEKDVTLLGFDGAGNWERRPKRIDISEITQIRFGSHYLDLFQKHLVEERAAKRNLGRI
jgi:hypothetical protein